MKTLILLSTSSFFLFLSGTSYADGNAPQVVQNEYAKQQAQLEAQLSKAKHVLRDLEGQKEKAITESKTQGQKDLDGVRALKRYDTLMTSRYATEAGEFQGWRPLTAADVDNINKLFDLYLHARPLMGRVSGGQAHRTLDWGMSRLEQLAKLHNSPESDNNSDLEIISHQMKEAQATVKSVMASADRLGIKLDPKTGEEQADNRQSASDATQAPSVTAQ